MPPKLNVITGATGLLGSHIAELLAGRGERVRALVRPTSDVAFLRQLGVEFVRGDLSDKASLLQAVAGADVVYHCAARVGDFGPWKLFRQQVVVASRNVVEACRLARVGRLLHVSSIGVYGHLRRAARPITEDEPLGQNLRLWDYYCRAKIQAEKQVCRLPQATIVRPTWIFGPRDRTSFPRLVKGLRAGWVSLLGSGDNPLNIVYAADVAEGAILAANHPEARGKVYHLSSPGEITQRAFYDLLTDALDLPRVTRRFPFWLAHWGGYLGDAIARFFRWTRPPYISRYTVNLIGRPVQFSSERARRELDWQPRVTPSQGLGRTIDWFRAQGRWPI